MPRRIKRQCLVPVTAMKNGVLVHVSINTSTGHTKATKAKMAVRNASERFAALRIMAFFLWMAGFIAPGFIALRGVALAAAPPEGEDLAAPVDRA